MACRHVASDESATKQSQTLGSQTGSSSERSSPVPLGGQGNLLATPSQRRTQVADIIQRGPGQSVPTTGTLTCGAHRKDGRFSVAESGHADDVPWLGDVSIEATGPTTTFGMHPEVWRWEDLLEGQYEPLKIDGKNGSPFEVGWMDRTADKALWKEGEEQGFANRPPC